MARAVEGMRPPQLPLALALPDHATLDTFEPGDNALVLKALERFLGARGERLWLWGPRGREKATCYRPRASGCRGASGCPGRW